MAIRALFGGLRRGAAEPRRDSRLGAPGGASVASFPRYPAFDAGIPASPVGELLREHADLLGRIRVAYGGEEGSCEARLVPVIEAYAAFVHRLPATPDAHFRGEGGLLRLGLEVGFHALQAADGQIFSARRTVPERRALEPRWRTAAFVAGLCAELHRTLAAVVVAADDEEVWCPFTRPLARWLEEKHHERYFVRWVESGETDRAAGVLVLPHVVPPALIAYLTEGNQAVLPQLMASLGGVAFKDHGALDGIVRRTLGLVIDRDLRTRSPRLRPSAAPPRNELSLADALRHLARSEAWSPNRPGSPGGRVREGVLRHRRGREDRGRRLLASRCRRQIPLAFRNRVPLPSRPPSPPRGGARNVPRSVSPDLATRGSQTKLDRAVTLFGVDGTGHFSLKPLD